MEDHDTVTLKEFIESKFNDFDKRLSDKFSVIDSKLAVIDTKLQTIDARFCMDRDKYSAIDKILVDIHSGIDALEKRMDRVQTQFNTIELDVTRAIESKVIELKATGKSIISIRALIIAGSIIGALVAVIIYLLVTFFVSPVLKHIDADNSSKIKQERLQK